MTAAPRPQPQAFDLECAELAQAVYDNDKRQVGRWTRVLDPDLSALPGGSGANAKPDPTSGFKAAAFSDGDRHVLAFAGSEAQTRDWLTNAGQSLGLGTAQYGQAAWFAKKCREALGGEITMTGHSLGGGLATIASAVTGCPAVTFNPAGVHDKTFRRAGIDPDAFRSAAEQGLVRNYIVRGEVLDRVQRLLPVPEASGQRIELDGGGRNTFGKHRIGVAIEGLEAKLDDPGRRAGVPRPQLQAAQKAMADTFRVENAREGLKKHPGLENAYAVLRVLEDKAAAMPGPAGEKFRQLGRENLAVRIERGEKIPAIPTQDRSEAARSAPAATPRAAPLER